MKYTRSQFAKIFGFSMESLRYLEKTGAIHVSRNEDNQYMEYPEDQIPVIYAVKVFQSAGIGLERILPLSKEDLQVPDHLCFLNQCIDELQQKQQEISDSIRYLRFIRDVYERETACVNALSLRTEESWQYMYFDAKALDPALIKECMTYLPHLGLMITVNHKELENEKYPVRFAFDLPLHVDCCRPLIQIAEKSGKLQSSQAGLYVYKVIFKENVLDLCREDIQDMLDYAKQHSYIIEQELFGVVMGPQIVNGKKGFYLRLFLLLEKEKSLLP